MKNIDKRVKSSYRVNILFSINVKCYIYGVQGTGIHQLILQRCRNLNARVAVIKRQIFARFKLFAISDNKTVRHLEIFALLGREII